VVLAQAVKRCTFLLFAVLAVAASPILAETPGEWIERYAATQGFRLGKPASIRVVPDGSAVLFLRSGPRSPSRDLFEVDTRTGSERVLASAEKLLGGAEEKLTAEERARRERMRLTARGIASYDLSADGKRILVPLSGRLYVLERATGVVRELGAKDAPAPIDARFSPDGKRIALVRDGELAVIDVGSGVERALTSDESPDVTNGLAEFVAQEEMGRLRGYWWSPDSRSLAYERADTSAVERFHIADVFHPEKAPDEWPYPRPGGTNADVKLGVIPVEGGTTTWVDWDRKAFEYLATVTWDEGAPLTLLVQNRRQTEERLLAADPATGKTTTLLVERDTAWLELADGMPHWLAGGREFLWMTERNGAWQLELHDRTGALVRALTEPGLGLTDFALVRPAAREAIVMAGADPTRRHVYRVPLGGGKPVRVTEADGVHGVPTSDDGARFVIRSAPLAGEETFELAGDAGRAGLRLRSVAEPAGLDPRLEFTETATDPALHAVVVRPHDFVAGRKYPVLLQVYGGPGSQTVLADPGVYLLQQWRADHGYVVVSIDGRGTPGRGRDFARATKNDLISVPLADQVTGLHALGTRYPELDLSRCGITGWSFGGYFSAMAVLREPGTFRAGVAGAPVVTWEDYDTHYTERYMGLPAENAEGYRSANVLTYADRLSRPLLVIHGTADDNVYPIHSLKLVDALFRAGKQVDFVPLAGFTHMVPEPAMRRRVEERILAYFDEHLLGPPGFSAPAAGETKSAP
jgi:dipeptidyl-peptidase-4